MLKVTFSVLTSSDADETNAALEVLKWPTGLHYYLPLAIAWASVFRYSCLAPDGTIHDRQINVSSFARFTRNVMNEYKLYEGSYHPRFASD